MGAVDFCVARGFNAIRDLGQHLPAPDPGQFPPVEGQPVVNAGLYVPMAIFSECLWNAFLRRRFSMELSKVLPSLPAGDFVFREMVHAILSIVRCTWGALVFSSDEPDNLVSTSWSWNPTWIGGNCVHFSSELARGFHEYRTRPGSAPQETTYWLAGVVRHDTLGLVDLANRRVDCPLGNRHRKRPNC